MTHESSMKQVAISRPKITLLMVLCGVAGAAASGAVSAASVADEVPQRVVKYSPDTLNTDTGVRSLYHRIVKAAEEVCPATSGSRWVTTAVAECRAQSVARAVHQIDNPRLAALYAASSKSG
ncbi:MAG TPA: UrcA family protein [Steroidobacteraceae bacterium]|nr:UrcA family protein [Steroidobacteraceae bacterium]